SAREPLAGKPVSNFDRVVAVRHAHRPPTHDGARKRLAAPKHGVVDRRIRLPIRESLLAERPTVERAQAKLVGVESPAHPFVCAARLDLEAAGAIDARKIGPRAGLRLSARGTDPKSGETPRKVRRILHVFPPGDLRCRLILAHVPGARNRGMMTPPPAFRSLR